MASGDIHLIGSFLFFVAWYIFPTYTLRDNPKSATFTSLPSQTRTFLAARSRWTNPLSDRNSYVNREKFISPCIHHFHKKKENVFSRQKQQDFKKVVKVSILIFMITTESLACSLAKFYCQYADRQMNLKFKRRVSERERASRQFVIVKNKLMSFCNASLLLLTMNFVITLSK